MLKLTKTILLLLFALLIFYNSQAQEVECAFDDLFNKALSSSQEFQDRLLKQESAIFQTTKWANSADAARNAPVVLPVVIHVVHNGASGRIPLNQALSAISFLNQAFENASYYDQGTGVNTEISFCLAKRDPFDLPTSGINYINSSLSNLNYELDDLNLKNLSRWDPTEYINIWVVNEICNSNGCGVAGYAYFPTSHGLANDGIVVESDYFGTSPENTSVLIHEMGHYLGLYHTFQNGCFNNDCLQNGDKVCDTPPDRTTIRVPCTSTVNSCNTDARSGFSSDQDDLFNNYMDYSNVSCYNAFTLGQSNRMHISIQSIRNSLLNSKACQEPCPDPITLDLMNPSTSIDLGTLLNFSANTNATSLEWFLNDSPIGTGSSASYQFNTEGTFKIKVVASNSNALCTDLTDSITITVYCPAIADFELSEYSFLTNTIVNTNNKSIQSNDFEWSVDGNLVSTNQNHQISFPTPGIREICLKAISGNCEDEKCYYISVLDSTAHCNPSFFNSYGESNKNEYAHSLLVTKDGNLVMVGTQDNETIIIESDLNGNILWNLTLNASQQYKDEIMGAFIDSDGHLVACGFGRASSVGSYTGFVFKIDMNTRQVLWIQETLQQKSKYYFGIKELPNDGNYIVIGETYSNVCDAVILEIDRNTGDMASFLPKTLHVGACQDFTDAAFHNNSIYAIGRFTIRGKGNDGMRGAITKFDLSGNEIWSKSFLKSTSDNARIYARSLVIENNHIFSTHFGDFNGTNLSQSSFAFCKHDLDGNILWAKHFTNPSVSIYTWNLISSFDGFYILGNDAHISGNLFVIKLSKNGDLIWSKAVDMPSNFSLERGIPLQILGDDIYFTSGIAGNGLSDVFLGKIGVDGNSVNANCVIFNDFPFTVTDLIQPLTFPISTSKINIPFTHEPISSNIWNGQIETFINCKEDCPEDCFNGVDDDGDGLIDCEDPDCDCCTDPDGVYQIVSWSCKDQNIDLELSICNYGLNSLPIGTPVSFFYNDPRISTNLPFHTIRLIEPLEKDSCLIIHLPVPAQNTGIHIVGNVDSSTIYPLSSMDLIGSGNGDCDRSNNIDYLLIQIPDIDLDLGDDIILCDNDVISLSAGDNFINYRWSNASTESTITTDGPGSYWCCVSNGCNIEACDTILIEIEPQTILDLGPDVEICQGNSVLITNQNNNFDNLQWFPKNLVDCDTCLSNLVSPVVTTEYTVLGTTDLGCLSIDTVQVRVLPAIHTYENLFFCEGDTVLIFGVDITEPGDYSNLSSNVNGCDSTHTISLLEVIDTSYHVQNERICFGDSIFFNNNWISNSGNYEEIRTLGTCTVITELNLTVSTMISAADSLWFCEGDSVLVFDAMVGEAGMYSKTYTATNGCDSIHNILAIQIDSISTLDSLSICENEFISIFGVPTNTPGKYSQIFQSVSGCDSLVTFELIVIDTVISSDNHWFCPNDSVFFEGVYYTENTVIIDSLLTHTGCDSIILRSFIAHVPIDASFEITPSCDGVSNGAITINPSQGDGPFTYFLNGTMTGSTISNLIPDNYSIEIVDKNNCSEIFEVSIAQVNSSGVAVGTDIRCFGYQDGSITFSPHISGNLYSLNGIDFQQDPVFNNLPEGDYELFIKTLDGCYFSQSLSLSQPNEIQLNLSGNQIIELGDGTIITANSNTADLMYYWTPNTGLDCDTCSMVHAIPIETTTYVLSAIDSNLCEALDSIEIRVASNYEVYIPSAFSPNDDGINDFFTVFGSNSVSSIQSLQIYDRWGSKLYEGKNLIINEADQGWDGTFKGEKLNSGVFVYYITVEFKDGSTEVFKGDITLFR